MRIAQICFSYIIANIYVSFTVIYCATVKFTDLFNIFRSKACICRLTVLFLLLTIWILFPDIIAVGQYAIFNYSFVY